MATTYAGAVRNGSMAAARLHMQVSLRDRMQEHGGNVDVFGVTSGVNLPLLLRPLKGLLRRSAAEPTPGVLVTTERPLSIQRFTAAHELGHFKLGHEQGLDDESILRRMALPQEPAPSRHDLQEVEADAFAVEFLMPMANRMALQPARLEGARFQRAAKCLSTRASARSKLRSHHMDASTPQPY